MKYYNSPMGFFEKKTARNRNLCPYCGFVFKNPPKRKTKCSKCDEECFVRTKQEIINSDLLTEADALAVDFFDEIQYLGATLDEYRRIEKDLEQKWGQKPNSYDIVWGLSNWLVVHPPKSETNSPSSLLQHAKMVAFAQALYQLRRGKDPYGYLKAVHDYEIQIGTMDDKSRLLEVQTNGCCEECSRYQGKQYTASQLKNNPILPIKECTSRIEQKKYAWCMCWYSPAV